MPLIKCIQHPSFLLQPIPETQLQPAMTNAAWATTGGLSCAGSITSASAGGSEEIILDAGYVVALSRLGKKLCGWLSELELSKVRTTGRKVWFE